MNTIRQSSSENNIKNIKIKRHGETSLSFQLKNLSGPLKTFITPLANTNAVLIERGGLVDDRMCNHM